MAKKNPLDALQDAMATDGSEIKFKSYGADRKGFYELEENSFIAGIFIGVKDQQITDIRTHLPKIIRVYSIRSQDGNIEKVGSRALLDGLFDDAMDEHGGVTVDNNRYSGPGIDWLRGKVVKIVRGEDKVNKATKSRMGMYEFLVEEDD
jgi:hypothetical protein